MDVRAALLLVLSATALRAQTPTPVPVVPGTVYFDFQVERPVTASPKNKPPVYPMVFRRSNVEGEVLAKFVVDSTGQVILSSFGVIKSSDELFSQAVRDVLPSLRFTPAQIGKQKVAQLVQMPFVFSLVAPDTGFVFRR